MICRIPIPPSTNYFDDEGSDSSFEIADTLSCTPPKRRADYDADLPGKRLSSRKYVLFEAAPPTVIPSERSSFQEADEDEVALWYSPRELMRQRENYVSDARASVAYARQSGIAALIQKTFRDICQEASLSEETKHKASTTPMELSLFFQAPCFTGLEKFVCKSLAKGKLWRRSRMQDILTFSMSITPETLRAECCEISLDSRTFAEWVAREGTSRDVLHMSKYLY